MRKLPSVPEYSVWFADRRTGWQPVSVNHTIDGAREVYNKWSKAYPDHKLYIRRIDYDMPQTWRIES